ncbi:hypothetical protein SLS62_005441 [Diatrype stigma]|uniref:WW domain-containing protein n=1 Tax=Diatrype stigma TaxID=117547 RepID=A0AAN9YS81_9PEZI
MDLAQLRKTLPPSWIVTRTLEGRHLFIDQKTDIGQWRHPLPEIDPSRYEQQPSATDGFEPQYEALSYVWGSDNAPHFIFVDPAMGDEENTEKKTPTKLAVTENLMTALRHLRDPSKARTLWIDAICINQGDEEEESHQVQRRDIPVSVPSCEVEQDCWRIFQRLGTKHPEWYDPAVELPYDQKTWDAILALLRRPWFERLWIVQEIQLAGSRPGAVFQCGTRVVSSYLFKRAIVCLSKKELGHNPELRERVLLAYTLFETIAGSTFNRLLTFTECQCKDPRGKIYALRGLTSRRLTSIITPEYGDSTTAKHTYKAVFLAHARLVQQFELFFHCFLDGRSILDMPSWVPDWSSVAPWDNYPQLQFAAGASRAQFTYDANAPNVLQVLGARCGVVSRVTRPMPKYLRSRLAYRVIRRWQPSNLETGTYGPTGEPLLHAYATVLKVGELEERFPRFGHGHFADWVRQDGPNTLFDGSSVVDLAGGTPDSDAYTVPPMQITLDRALQHCENRILVQTHEGYIGLVPEDTEIGDVIAVFLGCSNPLVLHPTPDGTAYRVKGQCFVHGANDCIRFLGPLPEPWRVVGTMGRASRCNFRFFNPDTGEQTAEDPRLGPLPAEWEKLGEERELECDDPLDCAFFWNTTTGETVNYDPRLEPEALSARGVRLETFVLV